MRGNTDRGSALQLRDNYYRGSSPQYFLTGKQIRRHDLLEVWAGGCWVRGRLHMASSESVVLMIRLGQSDRDIARTEDDLYFARRRYFGRLLVSPEEHFRWPAERDRQSLPTGQSRAGHALERDDEPDGAVRFQLAGRRLVGAPDVDILADDQWLNAWFDGLDDDKPKFRLFAGEPGRESASWKSSSASRGNTKTATLTVPAGRACFRWAVNLLTRVRELPQPSE